MKDKIKELIQSIKSWNLVKWIINFRYVGYGIILINLLMDGIQESIPNLIMFGGIVILIEKQAKKK